MTMNLTVEAELCNTVLIIDRKITIIQGPSKYVVKTSWVGGTVCDPSITEQTPELHSKNLSYKNKK